MYLFVASFPGSPLTPTKNRKGGREPGIFVGARGESGNEANLFVFDYMLLFCYYYVIVVVVVVVVCEYENTLL